mmetsp:Transcript_59423/g.150558  ORF Transcript_59423/g.150558 Transcript_59423/m.150558 type:complete len:264 (+) Transcript_59423:1082-1873(+)
MRISFRLEDFQPHGRSCRPDHLRDAVQDVEALADHLVIDTADLSGGHVACIFELLEHTLCVGVHLILVNGVQSAHLEVAAPLRAPRLRPPPRRRQVRVALRAVGLGPGALGVAAAAAERRAEAPALVLHTVDEHVGRAVLVVRPGAVLARLLVDAVGDARLAREASDLYLMSPRTHPGLELTCDRLVGVYPMHIRAAVNDQAVDLVDDEHRAAFQLGIRLPPLLHAMLAHEVDVVGGAVDDLVRAVQQAGVGLVRHDHPDAQR